LTRKLRWHWATNLLLNMVKDAKAIKAYSAPWGNPADGAAEAMGSTKRSVLIEAYCFSSPKITDAPKIPQGPSSFYHLACAVSHAENIWAAPSRPIPALPKTVFFWRPLHIIKIEGAPHRCPRMGRDRAIVA
jgi:hypothetical protein